MIDDSGLIRRTPPDPKEPVGCPDNPLQTMSYNLLVPYAPNAGNTPNDRRPVGVSNLTLYDLKFGALDTAPPREAWGGEEGPREMVEFICLKATRHEELPNGLSVCHRQQSAEQTRIEDWMASYEAHPDIYTTPLGRTFSFYCGGDLHKDGIDHCDIGYSITPALGVTYWFEPYRGRVVLPIDRVLEFDRGLRSIIEAAIVKGFRWPHFDTETIPPISGSKK